MISPMCSADNLLFRCGNVFDGKNGRDPNCFRKTITNLAAKGHQYLYGNIPGGSITEGTFNTTLTVEPPIVEWDKFFIQGRLFDLTNMPSEMKSELIDIGRSDASTAVDSGIVNISTDFDAYEVPNPYPD
jgi:hypothetical protein